METEKESKYLKGLMDVVENKLAITKKQIETVNFIFWLTCLCEKQITSTAMWVELSNWAKLGGMPKSDEFFEYVFEEISFMGKIKIMEKMAELYGSDVPQWKPFLSFFKKLNDSRNKIAHFKFKELMWDNKKIEEERTKNEIVDEILKLGEDLSEGVKKSTKTAWHLSNK